MKISTILGAFFGLCLLATVVFAQQPYWIEEFD
jgi:hypothetical protein